jgi:hypothetical protein
LNVFLVDSGSERGLEWKSEVQPWVMVLPNTKAALNLVDK